MIKHIRKGYDIPVAGKPEKEIVLAPFPKTIAIQPVEFQGVKPRILVKEGDMVKGGTPLFIDKTNPDIKFVAPRSGKILAIKYGERRKLLSIIIEPDKTNETLDFGTKSPDEISGMSREQVLSLLHESGTFTYLRQRPFNHIPVSGRVPKSIFINGMNTEPNSLDQGFVLKDRRDELQLGIEILKRLTDGPIHLCSAENGESGVFKELKGVENHSFSGPHPAGLVSTHIHFVDPINKGEIVWHISAVHLAAIGSLLKTGHFNNECYVAVSGTGVKSGKYFRTYIGADVESLFTDGLEDGDQRIVSGTLLHGTNIDREGHIRFYENSLQVLPEGRKRDFLGWVMPGMNKFSATSKVFLSSLIGLRDVSWTTNLNGGKRAIIWTDVFDRFTPLDIYTNFLIKAVLAEDLEEAEKLGILEVAEEDFSLATYLCPSKTDISSIIGKGLAMIEKEGY